MKKRIIFLLVAAVLILGGAVAAFGSATFYSWDLSAFDPDGSGDSGILSPDGDPLPPGPPQPL